jgi:hypothetical protein
MYDWCRTEERHHKLAWINKGAGSLGLPQEFLSCFLVISSPFTSSNQEGYQPLQSLKRTLWNLRHEVYEELI